MIENSNLASIIIFYLLAITIIVSAIGVAVSKNVMLACLSLLATLLGIAGAFIFLAADFMALVQILIYGGTVVTVIVFAIILTNLKDFSNLKSTKQAPFAVAACIVALACLITGILNSPISETALKLNYISLTFLGRYLFTDWAIPFELASLVLLIALIGTVLMVKANKETDK
ncbi:MAG: hypothetical protein FI687_04390 [SAR202 cluster bacterium]|nr:hypothetical protein [SAR202 cluster bacterium]